LSQIPASVRLARRKDGSGVAVRVITEIALQPGVAAYERYFDAAKDTEVQVLGEQVVSFPKLPDLTALTLRIERYRVYDEKLVITEAERVG
jgi:hypothetical protein